MPCDFNIQMPRHIFLTGFTPDFVYYLIALG